MMSDTQWPRFQVFVQEQPDAPHQDAGSVHAPDSEMALLNARDVFARRPKCVSMWVVPTEAIYSKTAEEILNQPPIGTEQSASSVLEPAPSEKYHVFCKFKHAGTQIQVGSAEASGPAQALEKAIEKYSSHHKPLVWWVFPARMVTQSDPSETGSLYEPAQDKMFRMHTQFHTLTAMRDIEQSKGRK